jgi:hypothetical protein
LLQCVSIEGDAPRQCHTTFGIFERSSDGGFLLKAFKQKLFVDGLSYLLQEIYGLENKSADVHPNQVFASIMGSFLIFYYAKFLNVKNIKKLFSKISSSR